MQKQAPVKPHWAQPSHPEIQEVFIDEVEFASKSLSRVSVPPFGLYAKMAFPPCTLADGATYATVQMSKFKHLNLNSDLLYINHSCEPSLIFDTSNLNIIAGPKGLDPGDELTFFYPSTEWEMAQPFDCLCGKQNCRGRISGAKNMPPAQLDGVWLNGHIRELLDEQQQQQQQQHQPPEARDLSGNGISSLLAADDQEDPTAQALRDALQAAEKVVEAARVALLSYVESTLNKTTTGAATCRNNGPDSSAPPHGAAVGRTGFAFRPSVVHGEAFGAVSGSARRGPTSRELSGEMGGDTALLA